jgi:serine/threonine protein kinase
MSDQLNIPNAPKKPLPGPWATMRDVSKKPGGAPVAEQSTGVEDVSGLPLTEPVDSFGSNSSQLVYHHVSDHPLEPDVHVKWGPWYDPQSTPLGEGGMAKVYRVMPGLVCRVYIDDEIMSPELLSEVDQKIKLHEGDVALKFKERPIAGTPEIHEVGPGHTIQEEVEATTLEEVLKTNGPLPRQTALEITHKIAGILAEAHKAGLVHRDLTPRNLMIKLGPQQELVDVSVLDFLMAKPLAASGIVDRGLHVGTPRFIAPEQARGIVVPESDTYPLGRILYQMLQGELFPIEGANGREIIEAVKKENIFADHPALKALDPDLRQLTADMLNPNAMERPTAAKLLPRLEAMIKGRPYVAPEPAAPPAVKIAPKPALEMPTVKELKFKPEFAPARKTSANVNLPKSLVDFAAGMKAAPPQISYKPTTDLVDKIDRLPVSDGKKAKLREIVEDINSGKKEAINQLRTELAEITAKTETAAKPAPAPEAAPASKPTAAPRAGMIKQVGANVGGLGAGIGAGLITDVALDKAGVKNPAVKFGASLVTGTAATVGITKAITGTIPSAASLAKGAGTGIAGGFLASSMYHSALGAAGVKGDSLLRSTPAELTVGVGGGTLFSAAGVAALPFGVVATINELPAMIDPEKAAAKANAVDKARQQMAHDFNYGSGTKKWMAGVALGLSLVPIFNKGIVGAGVDAKDGQ